MSFLYILDSIFYVIAFLFWAAIIILISMTSDAFTTFEFILLLLISVIGMILVYDKVPLKEVGE